MHNTYSNIKISREIPSGTISNVQLCVRAYVCFYNLSRSEEVSITVTAPASATSEAVAAMGPHFGPAPSPTIAADLEMCLGRAGNEGSVILSIRPAFDACKLLRQSPS